MDSASFGKAVEGDFGMHLTSIEKIKKGWQNQVYRAVTAEGETVFVRTNKNREVFDVELAGYKIYEQLGIPAPGIVDYQPNPSTIGFPTMIIRTAEGVSLDETNLSAEQEKTVYENLGEIVKKNKFN